MDANKRHDGGMKHVDPSTLTDAQRDDLIRQLIAENAELRAENAELRAENAEWV